MSESTAISDDEATAPAAPESAPDAASTDGARSASSSGFEAHWFSPRRIGAIYLWIAIIILFSILEPDLFLSDQTLHGIANSYSISGIAALAILVPLAAGVFDVSVGATMTLVGIVVAKLLGETTYPTWLIIVIGLACGVGVGLLNSLVVVVLRIPSLIGTLAVLGVVEALAVGVSDNQILSSTRLSGDFSRDVVATQIEGFTRPVFYVLIIMVILGLLLEQTQVGRFIYAAGFNAPAARLAGLRVKGLQTGAFMLGGLIAGFAGLVLAAQVSSASPGSGAPYLLPAFAAVFLGATQFRDLRFNAWGTVVAVFMLGTGQYGLLLVGAPRWMPDVFQGVALVVAIAITQFGGRERQTSGV